jgi:hypothetical protein
MAGWQCQAYHVEQLFYDVSIARSAPHRAAYSGLHCGEGAGFAEGLLIGRSRSAFSRANQE